MKTAASTDADQAVFLMKALRKRGLLVGRETDDLGRVWLVLGGCLPVLSNFELISQAKEFNAELLAVLAIEDAAEKATRPKRLK